MPQRSIHAKCFALSVGWLLPSHDSGEIKGSQPISRAVPICIRADAVFAPAAVDQSAYFIAHPDLLRPRPGALVGPLRGRVDSELAAKELVGRGVVEMVERALADHDVASRVDVCADV